MDRRELLAAIAALSAAPVCSAAGAAPQDGGQEKKKTPLHQDHVHVCGIHMSKLNPKLQFITHHYCVGHKRGAAGDVLQCVLLDGANMDAKLIGVEYIISDATYRTLSETEKKYWHPHTYEVLGGGLIAPGMDPKEELELMKYILPTWGKAWHTWPEPKDDVPKGEPMLIWSLMGDGQVDKDVLKTRDETFNINTKALCETRGKAIGYQVPNVALPKGLDTVGRKWTDNGMDEPKKRP